MHRIQQGIGILEEHKLDRIIVPPYAEHFCQKKHDHILPLFAMYIQHCVLPGSRIGKLGVINALSDEDGEQTLLVINEVVSSYQQSMYQQKTKTFKKNFPCWMKSCSHWDVHMLYAKQRSWIMRNLIKIDLRYFKDCNVDTLILSDW